MQGGDSGAWVGEMAFLQSLWDKDHAAPTSLQKKLSGQKARLQKTLTLSADDDAETSKIPESTEAVVVRPGLPPGDEPYKYVAISTIVAVEDIEIIEWSFDDMERVMKSSRDMKDSLTRAMTAAVVGKVVNFMVSRQSAIPKWSTMLDNWRHAGPRHRQDEEMGETEEEEEEEVNNSLQTQPLATSASWLFRHGLTQKKRNE